MKLNQNALRSERAAYEAGGFTLPAFDVSEMRARTLQSPVWLHFGAGNIFRAFIANTQARLLDAGLAQSGIIVCEGFDGDIIDQAYLPFDNLSVLAVLRADGKVDKKVVASVAQALRCDGARPQDNARMLDIFASDSLQMVSFTITEKGYAVTRPTGETLPYIQSDISGDPMSAKSTLGMVCAGLLARFRAGGAPIALVSMDNCSHNGDKLKAGVTYIARAWAARGAVEQGFAAYCEDGARVSFPLSMIDKITPRPDETVAEMLKSAGLEDTQTIITQKGTYTASFVNAEETEYLVIQDVFPNGRPMLEKAGVYLTDRDTVNNVERMKVCTCLNPLHTAMSVVGCMLGYTRIYEEMRDDDIRAFIEKIAYDEGMPVVTDPGILSPADFAREVITRRLPNPFMPDAPQRIATDTSQKLPIRFGVTLGAYAASDTLDIHSLRCIPFALAAWLRYTLGVDDNLNAFEPSSDPRLAQVQQALAGVGVGQTEQLRERVLPLLRDETLFGVNLEQVGIAELVLCDLADMLKGRGAVRSALHALVS